MHRGVYLGAEYPSPKKVNLSNYSRVIYKPQRVKGYLLGYSGYVSATGRQAYEIPSRHG